MEARMSADVQMQHGRTERCDTLRVATRWRGRWTADSASEQRHLLELFGGGVGEGLPLGAAIRAGLKGRRLACRRSPARLNVSEGVSFRFPTPPPFSFERQL